MTEVTEISSQAALVDPSGDLLLRQLQDLDPKDYSLLSKAVLTRVIKLIAAEAKRSSKNDNTTLRYREGESVRLGEGLIKMLPKSLIYYAEHKYACDEGFQTSIDNALGDKVAASKIFKSYFETTWELYDEPYDSDLLNSLDEESLKLLLEHSGAFELNNGCSVGCEFCSVRAITIKEKPEHFSYQDMHKLLVRYADLLLTIPRAFLYLASDPFDWEAKSPWSDQPLFYPDLHRMAKVHTGEDFYVSTAIPEGREELVRENLGILNRVSISYKNKARVRKHFPDLIQPPDPELKTSGYLHTDPDFFVYYVNINPDLNPRSKELGIKGGTKEPLDTPGCFDGVVPNPTGFRNHVQVRPNKDYPSGEIDADIDPTLLKQPLPRENAPIDSLLTRGVVEGRRFSNSGHSGGGHRGPMDELCGERSLTVVKVTNTEDSCFYVLDADQNLAIPCPAIDYIFTRFGLLYLARALVRTGYVPIDNKLLGPNDEDLGSLTMGGEMDLFIHFVRFLNDPELHEQLEESFFKNEIKQLKVIAAGSSEEDRHSTISIADIIRLGSMFNRMFSRELDKQLDSDVDYNTKLLNCEGAFLLATSEFFMTARDLIEDYFFVDSGRDRLGFEHSLILVFYQTAFEQEKDENKKSFILDLARQMISYCDCEDIYLARDMLPDQNGSFPPLTILNEIVDEVEKRADKVEIIHWGLHPNPEDHPKDS